MKALNLGRPELTMLEGAMNLAVEMMESYAARQRPPDPEYAALIADHRRLAQQITQLVQFGDAAERMGQQVQTGASMVDGCKKCGASGE